MKFPSKRTSAIRGAALIVGMRWIDRLIGILSTLILARLLVPDDFGVVAMAWMFIHLFDTLTDLGVNVALIRDQEATKEHYDTAWTVRLIQQFAGAAVIAAGAPLAGLYFNDARITMVLPVLAIGFVMTGLANIWVVDFQKNMAFGKDVALTLSRRLTAFLVTVILAWYLHSYWALVFGTLAGQATGLVQSYRMHPGRPTLCLRHWRSIFAVGQWMIVNNIGGYFDRNLPGLLIGRRNEASVLGGFTLAREISALPTTELLLPLNRVLFPLFSVAARDPVEIKRVYLLAQGVQCLVAIPAGVGLAVVGPEVISVLLGNRWDFAAPFVQLLALANVAVAITTSGNQVMIALGAMRNAALIAWIRAGIFLICALFFVPDFDALQLTQLRLITVISALGLATWMILRVLRDLTVMDVVGSMLRPTVSAFLMFVALASIGNVASGSAELDLIVKIVLGAIVYSTVLLLLWRISGKPDGAERYILSNIAPRWNNLLKGRR